MGGSNSTTTSHQNQPKRVPQTSAAIEDIDTDKLSTPSDDKKYKISVSGVDDPSPSNGKKHSIVTPHTPKERKPRTPSYSGSTNDGFGRREREITKILKKAKEEQDHWMKIIDSIPKYDEFSLKCKDIISVWIRECYNTPNTNPEASPSPDPDEPEDEALIKSQTTLTVGDDDGPPPALAKMKTLTEAINEPAEEYKMDDIDEENADLDVLKEMELKRLKSTLDPTFDQTTIDVILLYVDDPDKGIFGHTKKNKIAATRAWALARFEWCNQKVRMFDAVLDELYLFEDDWETNTKRKRYWKCQTCKHSNIKELYIEMEQDNSYHYNYKREISKVDFQFAYNVKMSCKSKRIPIGEQKPRKIHHSVYYYPNLRKYEVVERFAMHRCKVCGTYHICKDKEKYKECDECKCGVEKHDQIWCKHADEFDGTEEVIDKKRNNYKVM